MRPFVFFLEQLGVGEELFVETPSEMDAEPLDRPDCDCGGPKAWDWDLDLDLDWDWDWDWDWEL